MLRRLWARFLLWLFPSIPDVFEMDPDRLHSRRWSVAAHDDDPPVRVFGAVKLGDPHPYQPYLRCVEITAAPTDDGRRWIVRAFYMADAHALTGAPQRREARTPVIRAK